MKTFTSRSHSTPAYPIIPGLIHRIDIGLWGIPVSEIYRGVPLKIKREFPSSSHFIFPESIRRYQMSWDVAPGRMEGHETEWLEERQIVADQEIQTVRHFITVIWK